MEGFCCVNGCFVSDLVNRTTKFCSAESKQKVRYDYQNIPKSHVNGQNLLNIVCSQFIVSVWIV